MLTSNCSFLGDLQEPFRWIADVTVMDAFESGVLDLPNFYFTGDDYRYRFELDAKRRFIQALREQFNSGVKYKSCVLKWDTVIEQKTNELCRFLTGKAKSLDFVVPALKLFREDNSELQAKILELTHSEAKQLGNGKSTLCHLHRNAKSRNLSGSPNVLKKLAQSEATRLYR